MNSQKSKTEETKSFDTVQYFRNVKNRIAKETNGMSFKELKEYFHKRTIKTSKSAAV